MNISQTRKNFRASLSSGKPLQFVGAFNAMVAQLIEQYGFDGVYGSGAVISNALGLPDVGLTTLSEVAHFTSDISSKVKLPVIVDADTGFGGPGNTARTIALLEQTGATGCHIEDQVNPKRCGHLEGKELVSSQDMTQKIKAAVQARTDPNFILIARTDAKGVEGIDAAIDRAKAYVDAGADMIFPEALHNVKEMEAFRKAVKVPLLLNMTEFGKSDLLSIDQIAVLGYEVVIYPVTLQRLAMFAVEEGLKSIKASGSQEGLLHKMQTRKRLYEVLKYDYYIEQDKKLGKS